MSWALDAASVDAVCDGLDLLGGGGGGSAGLFARLLRSADLLPLDVQDPEQLDPQTPCLAVGMAGSTLMVAERLPSLDAAERGIAAAERWLGHAVPVVCSIEHAGANGLTSAAFRGDRSLVDADLLGRALPRIDQLSLLVDEVPGLVFTVATSGAGVMLLDGPRTADAEPIIREALRSAGGWAVLVIAGFTVGTLAQHAMTGTLRRARDLGLAFAVHGATPELVAGQGEVLGTARIDQVSVVQGDLDVTDIELRSHDGDAVRVVASSEFTTCLWNGAPVAESPDIIALIDTWSGAVLQVADVRVGMVVVIVRLDAPAWWRGTPGRLHAARRTAVGG